MNRVIILGRLGQDPQLTVTNNNISVCKFSMATSEVFKDKQGNKKERVEWHSIVVFGSMANACNDYLKKGDQCLVEGKLTTTSWNDKNTNEKRYKTDIISSSVTFLQQKKKEDQKKESGLPPFDPFQDLPAAQPMDEIPF